MSMFDGINNLWLLHLPPVALVLWHLHPSHHHFSACPQPCGAGATPYISSSSVTQHLEDGIHQRRGEAFANGAVSLCACPKSVSGFSNSDAERPHVTRVTSAVRAQDLFQGSSSLRFLLIWTLLPVCHIAPVPVFVFSQLISSRCASVRPAILCIFILLLFFYSVMVKLYHKQICISQLYLEESFLHPEPWSDKCSIHKKGTTLAWFPSNWSTHGLLK